jgi:hypothetical protein
MQISCIYKAYMICDQQRSLTVSSYLARQCTLQQFCERTCLRVTSPPFQKKQYTTDGGKVCNPTIRDVGGIGWDSISLT